MVKLCKPDQDKMQVGEATDWVPNLGSSGSWTGFFSFR